MLLLPHVLSLVLLTNSSGRALDGSPGAFYIRPSPQSRTWVIALEGGGLCVTPTECQHRAKTDLGTSTHLPSTMTGSRIFSADCGVNPQFCGANLVHVEYLSGDLWSGMRNETLPEYGVYFSGHLILEALFARLKRDYGLASATQVVFTGFSAGGIASIAHLDWAAAQVPQARTVGVADSGFYINARPYRIFPPAGLVCEELAVAKEVYDGFVPTACAAANPKQPWVCYCGTYSVPHIVTPILIAENGYDQQQICQEDLVPCGSKKDHDKVVEYFKYWGGQMREDLAPLLAPGNNATAVFSPSCFLHGVNFNHAPIGKTTLQQAVSQWSSSWLAQTGPLNEVKLLDDCGDLPCGSETALGACPTSGY